MRPFKPHFRFPLNPTPMRSLMIQVIWTWIIRRKTHQIVNIWRNQMMMSLRHQMIINPFLTKITWMFTSRALSPWTKFSPLFKIFMLMNLSFLFWNRQGAASQSFQRIFKMFAQNYRPMLVALCEPRISGVNADDFILFSGYDRSHRVEAADWNLVIVERGFRCHYPY